MMNQNDTVSATKTKTRPYNDPPLPLEDLKPWISSTTVTIINDNDNDRSSRTGNGTDVSIYEWLQRGDIKAKEWQIELENHGSDQIVNLFATNNNDHDNEDDDDDSSIDSTRSDIDFEDVHGRLRVWTSSTTNVNGIGMKYRGDENKDEKEIAIIGNNNNNDEEESNHSFSPMQVIYIISESWEGYGDMLWSSSRYLANQFANPQWCHTLLYGNEDKNDCVLQSPERHPLRNKTLLELGAGCALPSLVAMKCSTKAVVATDLDDTNRIRSIAEAMERNFISSHNNNNNVIKGRAHPFRWEHSTTPVLKVLQEMLTNEDHDDTTTTTSSTTTTTSSSLILPKFDIICATDCLFITWLHEYLIRAIDELLHETHGIAILAFAIHAAYSKSDDVWKFIDKVKSYQEGKRLQVEILPSIQLTPPKKGMPLEQGLIHTIRLTRPTVM